MQLAFFPNRSMNPLLQRAGQKGGKRKSPAKKAAAARNGIKGGRPTKAEVERRQLEQAMREADRALIRDLIERNKSKRIRSIEENTDPAEWSCVECGRTLTDCECRLAEVEPCHD